MANEEEQINFEKEEVKAADDNQETDINFEDTTGNFVAHPKCGEETGLLVVKRFYTSKNVSRKDKEGNPFSIGLRQTDGIEVAYLLETDKGIYTCGTWEEVGKVKAIARELHASGKKGKIEGFTINVKHIADGSLATKKAEEVSKLKEVSVEEAQKLIDASKEAKKQKKCYDVVLVKNE